MTFYVLQGLRIKSKWKEASSTQTVWKAFIFAGNLAWGQMQTLLNGFRPKLYDWLSCLLLTKQSEASHQNPNSQVCQGEWTHSKIVAFSSSFLGPSKLAHCSTSSFFLCLEAPSVGALWSDPQIWHRNSDQVLKVAPGRRCYRRFHLHHSLKWLSQGSGWEWGTTTWSDEPFGTGLHHTGPWQPHLCSGWVLGSQRTSLWWWWWWWWEILFSSLSLAPQGTLT